MSKDIDVDAGIDIVKIWSDEDMVELRIQFSDGASQFSNKVYVGHQHLKDTVIGLDRFKDQVHGGIHDLRFGEFGPEYASGAFHARLHFQDRGKIHITVSAQSDFFDFGKKRIASEATLYLIAEPSQLDEFIRALGAVSEGHDDNAKMNASMPSSMRL
jgi:hypothetical protein